MLWGITPFQNIESGQEGSESKKALVIIVIIVIIAWVHIKVWRELTPLSSHTFHAHTIIFLKKIG